MNHKRKRPKKITSGCQMCKAEKAGWGTKTDRLRPSDRRRLDATRVAA